MPICKPSKENCIKCDACIMGLIMRSPAPEESKGPSGRAVVGCPPHQATDARPDPVPAWPIACPHVLDFINDPCGDCDLCEIMEQDKYIALLANEAVINR